MKMGGGCLPSSVTAQRDSAVLSWGGTSDVQTQKCLHPDCLYRRPIDVLWEVVSAGLCDVDVSDCFVNI